MGRFEKLDHDILGEGQVPVPLFYAPGEGLTDESRALLEAANLFGAEILGRGEDITAETVGELAVRIETIIDDETAASEVVPDPQGGGSVKIEHETTTVYRRGIEESMVLPTELVARMIGEWQRLLTGSPGMQQLQPANIHSFGYFSETRIPSSVEAGNLKDKAGGVGKKALGDAIDFDLPEGIKPFGEKNS